MSLHAVTLSSVVFALTAVALAACSSSTGTSDGAPAAADAAPAVPDDGADAGPDVTADPCPVPTTKSGCANEDSWIRGIVKFDPSHYKAGSKPILRVALRHRFTYFAGEDTIGGRLHAYDSYPLSDAAIAKGEIPFT